MKFRLFFPLFYSLSALGLCFWTSCKEKTPTPISSPQQKEQKPNSTKTFNAQNAYDHTAAIVAFGTRPPGSKELENTRNYISKQLALVGWKASPQAFEIENTPLGKQSFCNLTARFGDTKSRPKIVLSCHIDTLNIKGFVGANDGAAHAGLIIELARILAQEPKLAEQIELAFFDGEEALAGCIIPGSDGLFGSTYFVQTRKNENQLPDFAINVDMPGNKDLCLTIPSDTPPELYSIWREIVQTIPAPRGTFRVLQGIIYDDHLPFQQEKIPAINLIADFQNSTWWHTNDDNMEQISPKSLEYSAQLTLGIIKKLLNDN